MTILILPLLATEILIGFLAVDFFDYKQKFSKPERILSAVLLGFVLSSFAILLLALVFKSLEVAIVIFLIASFVAISIFRKKFIAFFYIPTKNGKTSDSGFRLNLFVIIFLFSLLIYAIYLLSLLAYDGKGNLSAPLPGWGDNAFHLSLIERFSVSSPFILEHPLFSGINLPYPFMIDFISAVLRNLGADQVFAFRLPLFIFGILAISLLFLFIFRQYKSWRLALLAVCFILLGSGLGFVVAIQDIQAQGISLEFFKNPPHQYTNLDPRTGTASENVPAWSKQIVWIVPVISFLGHQRSFVLGLTVFIFLLLGIYHYKENKDFWRFGLIAGLLPLIHSHTLIALSLLMACLFWFFLKNYKSWLAFAGVAFLMALPQLVYLFSNGAKTQGFVKPWFGWMACSHQTSWLCDSPANPILALLSFSLKNFGAIFIIWIAASILSFSKKMCSPFFYASLVIFFVANLFLFQPWEFDNNKILFYWWILAIIFGVIPLLNIMWHRNLALKILAVFLVFSAISAGAVDFIGKTTKPAKASSFGYDDSSTVKTAAAKWINQNTPENTVFLSYPNAGNFVSIITGRIVYMGYDGWLWSQGINYLPRQAKMTAILRGNVGLACREKIDYLALDQNMMQNFPINAEIVEKNTETVFSQKENLEQVIILKINCK